MQDTNAFNLQLHSIRYVWYIKHKMLNTDIWNYLNNKKIL